MTEVSHVITTIERGGAENQLLILVREQVLLGVNVTVIPLKGNPELCQDLIDSGANVDLRIINKSIFVQVAALRKALRKAELVHAHLPRAELLAALSARKIFVFSRHNTEQFFPGAPRLVSSALSRFVTLRANSGIAISKAVRNYLIDSGEVSRNLRIDVVLYGIPDCVTINLPRVKQLKAKMKILDTDYIVGTIARLAPQKDLFTLLRAFALTNSSLPNAKLVIIGTGPDREYLAKEASKLGISDRIIWVGRTSEIYEYLAIMDVFVLTSLYEGFGLVLVEAMVAECPIVASNNSAIPEVLGEDHIGLAQTSNAKDFANKIIALSKVELKSNVLLQQKIRIPHFNSREMSLRILNIYNSIKS